MGLSRMTGEHCSGRSISFLGGVPPLSVDQLVASGFTVGFVEDTSPTNWYTGDQFSLGGHCNLRWQSGVPNGRISQRCDSCLRLGPGMGGWWEVDLPTWLGRLNLYFTKGDEFFPPLNTTKSYEILADLMEILWKWKHITSREGLGSFEFSPVDWLAFFIWVFHSFPQCFDLDRCPFATRGFVWHLGVV